MSRIAIILHAFIATVSVPAGFYFMFLISFGQPSWLEWCTFIVYLYGALNSGMKVWAWLHIGSIKRDAIAPGAGEPGL